MSRSFNKGYISAGNSTTSTLASSATYTGTWEQVGGYDSVTVAVKTDQDGTFTVEFSPDGTNTDSTLTRYYRTSQIEVPHRFTITRDYFRVTFTNTSASAQTTMRLQTTVSPNKGDLNAPMDSTLAQDFDATVTRPTDYTTEVALGRRQGATTWNKFGYNTGVRTSEEVIAQFGGALQYITSGETIDVVSSSTNDVDTTGTGVRKIIVYGVDENWDTALEVINMNGTTTVTTTSQWIGINRIAIYQSGSGNSNAGTITVTATTSGYTMATMPVGEGTSQQLMYFVPQNHQFLATWLYLNAIKSSGGGSPVVDFKGYVYSNVVDSEFEVYRSSLDTSVSEVIELNPGEPFIIGEKSILWFTATSSSGGSDTEVQGRFSGKLIRDVDA